MPIKKGSIIQGGIRPRSGRSFAPRCPRHRGNLTTAGGIIPLDRPIILGRGTVTTGPAQDYTVKVDATGLAPNRNYYYRFRAHEVESPVGRTKTLPTGSVAQARFASGGGGLDGFKKKFVGKAAGAYRSSSGTSRARVTAGSSMRVPFTAVARRPFAPRAAASSRRRSTTLLVFCCEVIANDALLFDFRTATFS